MSAQTKFAEAVAMFSHGNRYDHYLSTVRIGLLALGDEAAVFEYIMHNAPPPAPNAAKVRQALRFAAAHPLPGQTSPPWRRDCAIIPSPKERAEARRRMLPRSARDFVPVTLREYDPCTASLVLDYIRATDTALKVGDTYYRAQAARQLRALFDPGEKTWAGWIVQDAAARARLGLRSAKTPLAPLPGDNATDPAVRAGVIEAHILADRIEAELVKTIPTHVSLNPVTGLPDARGSFDSASTIAAYRHVLVEWDNLFDVGADGKKTPSQAHAEIAFGLLNYAADHPGQLHVACMTWTGGKSIHTALRVEAGDLATYKRQTAALADLFASADDAAFRADPAAGWSTGYVHVRLAGAIRPETGRRARLIS